MARIKKYAPEQKLSSFQTFIVDENPNSDYFRITEFKDTFTGGKNGFLIEGSEYLKESTEIKIDIVDVNGDPIYYEPGNGIPEYYEGISKLIAVYIYEDTPIGLGKITILGELKEYEDNGVRRTIPENWKGAYNVKWERTFQINKNLANEDRVRFYRRPEVSITEINKPIFNNNSLLITKSGSVDGTPLVPIANTALANFSLPTSYRLKTADNNFWTGSIEGQIITFPSLNYSATINEVVNDTEIIVSPPYTQNNLVKPFTSEDYQVSFNYLEGVIDLATALTGSFAKINITDMKTFVGDAARVKVFRRSQSNLTDYEFVQEIQLESNELLRDIETTSANEQIYGNFTEDILNQYWTTSSNDFNSEFDRSFLYNSAKLDSTEGNYFYTAQSFNIQNGVEYTLDFNVRKGSTNSSHFLKAFLSGSLNGTPKSQTIVNIPSSTAILQKQNFNENILADEFDSAKLYFEVEGSDWYINNVSLKASQETSFSPDEITFIQQVPKTLQTETFDYRFEFYDINNNYIPVLVEETKTFDGGNLNLFNKSIEITPNQLYFTFDSASNPSNPLPPTTIIFDIQTSVVTGSVNFTSGAYNEFGDYISASEYVGGQYPGLLYDRETGTPTLHVSDFTGSRDDIFVQYIRFTGEVEGVSDSVVISRVQDGKGGVNFEIRPYRGTIIKNKSDKDLEVQAIRIDGINEIVLREGLPQVGFSDAKLRILTSSVNPSTSEVSSSYLLLSEATEWGVIRGVTAGTTGSGEIDYNAVFNRDSIDSELTLYLMDGITSESILTSIILTDLQDGLDGGYISFDAEQFGIKPRTEREFTPNIGRVTGSFYLRGTNENPISGTLDIYPSMSVDPETIEPTYYMFYVTNSFDRRVSIQVTDFDNNIINSGIPGQSGIPFYEAIPTKQLTTTFTYTEDYTSSSISTDKTFFSVPDGNPGDDAILVKIDPNPVVLNADQRGRVFNYNNANTEVTVTQGVLPLIFTGSKKPGTFTTASIITTGIEYSTFDNVSGDASMSLSGFSNMTDLTASIEYVLEIHPFFTASFFTQSYFQPFKKSLDGAAAINIELEPTVVSLIAEENGGVYSSSSANTTLKVKQGEEYLEYNTGSNVPGTFSASIDTTNILVGYYSSSKQHSTDRGWDDTLHYENFNTFTADSASVDYTITVYPFSITNGIVTGSQTFTRKQILTKNKEGVKARSVSLETTSQTVNFDGDGVVTSPIGSIFLTATAFNVTASQTYYQFFQDGFAYSTIGTDNTFEIGSGDATSPGNIATWKVEIRDGMATSPVVASSEVTIIGIKSGANNYQVFLTNPSPTVGVEVDGTTDFTKTGTQIKAFKGTQELTHVTNYSSPTLDLVGDPIGVLGEFSASIWAKDSYITQPNYPVGNPASVGPITAWTLPQDNPSATIVYKVDIEDGRATYFLSQSISTVFEGATGPGVVFRGPWTGSIEYIYNKDQKRRDAVLWSENGSEPYDTYYATKDSGSSYLVPSGAAYAPTIGGALNDLYWVSLGQEEFFVAAKIAIFEESFVKNTINVGTPPLGNPNANIAIVGGTDEPYIAIGQQGTQGYAQPGIWLGMSNDGGPLGTSGTMGLLSLKSTPVGGEYNSMEWDGETLTIRGAIRQTSAGVIEGSLRGTWSSGVEYYPNDIVSANGQSWVMIGAVHTSTTNDEPGVGVNYTTYWEVAASAGTSGTAAKTIRLSSDYQAFVVAKDGTITPSTITFTANRQNISTSTTFTPTPTVTLGGSGDTRTLSSTDFGANTSVTIEASADGLSDEITIVKVEEGSDAITIVVSNESHTFQADNSGTVSDYTNSGTDIVLYEGATQLDYDGVGTADGKWTVSASGSSIVVGSISDGGNYAVVGDHSSITANLASIVYTISGKKTNGNPFSFTKTQSFSKSIAGDNGTSGTSGQSGTSGTSGGAGAAGAGVVYRGIYDSGETYYDSATRRDVVQYNGSYYIANNEAKNGTATWGTPPTDWESFGAQFESVATDILFSQDVYANRTINVGASGGSPVIALNADSSSGYQNPFISIGQTSPGFLQNGIYFGYTGGNPVLSMVSGSTFFYYESGSIELSDASFVGSGSIIEGSSIRVGRNLDVSPTASNAYNFTVSSEGVVSASQAYIEGTIAASAGNIGNWVIDPIVNGDGGALRDSDSEIIFDPNLPEIQIYSGSVQRVFIGSSELTSISAVSSSFTWSGGEPIITSTTITSNASDGNLVSTNRYTGVSSTVSVTPGTYQFTDVDWPAITIVEPDAVSAGTQNYPNYTPSYAGQYHGGLTVLQQYPVNIAAALYLEVVDTNNGNAVIGSTLLGNQTATGDFGFSTGFVAVEGGFELSVTGDTEITLSDSSIKLAKDISTTDTILAWDEPNNKFSEATITNVKSREVDRIFEVTAGGLSVKVSETHGFWTDGGGEIKVEDIIVGETHIYIKDGDSLKFVVVDGVEEIVGNIEVYTLSVPPYVNYISNGIISHNAVDLDLTWEEQNLDLDNVGASKTITAGSAQTKNITISTTTTAAALRYRLVVATQSGVSKSVNASGTITNSWVQQTVDIAQTNTGGKEVYFASSPIDSDGISIVKSNNFVELKPAGFQLVTSENIYIRARRKDSLVNSTAADAELFRVEGGTSYFNAAPFPFDTSISVAGHIRPYEAGWDLGGSTPVLKFKNLNGFDIEDLAVSKSTSGYTRLFDNVIIQWVRSSNTSTDQVSGAWPTPFTAIYGATVSKGNASSTYESAQNAATVSYTTSNWYVDVNDVNRTFFIIAIGTKD